MPNVFEFSGLPQDWKPVTPSDTEDNVLDTEGQGAIALRADTAGTVTVVVSSGIERELSMAAGEIRPLWGFTRIKTTGTTASGIEVALIR